MTQIWDRGHHGRQFFEELIRENIDWGRPEQVQLIFGRRMQRKTATDGRCRTRILAAGVVPSLHVYYKNTHLKTILQGRAWVEDRDHDQHTYDFDLGRSLALTVLVSLTPFGLKAALFYARTYQRLLRPGFSELADARLVDSSPLAHAFASLQRRLDAYADQKTAA